MSYSGDRLLLSSQREGQISHFRGWVMVVVPVAAVAFQFYVPLFFQFLKFLEMPLLVVVYFALMRRTQISGLMIGAVVGLAQDSVFHNPLGMLGIDKTLVGYFAASVGMRFDVEHGFIRLLLCFLFYMFHQFFYWVIARALLSRPVVLDMANIALIGLLNAVVGVALFAFLDRLRD
jgi:rod shape-determining protein MreD